MSRGVSRWVLLLCLVAGTARGHDFWIEPSSFAPAAGAAVSFRLVVGQQWVGEAMPRSRERIVRFALDGPAGEKEIAGAEGIDPAGVGRVDGAGYYVAGYASNNSPLSLEAPKFEDYLKLEGLEWVIAERARRRESQAASREVYARCAKSLLRVPGTDAPPGFDRVLGYTLELVPERAPDALKAGDELPLRLLFRGKPLAGALVVAMPKAAPAAAVQARSDRKGRVKLALPGSGTWMVKAVHMVRLEGVDRQRENADWQSYWASLTFQMPAR